MVSQARKGVVFGGGARYAIVPPLVHLAGAACYQGMPGDGGYVPDLEGAGAAYTRCPTCFPPVEAAPAQEEPVKAKTKRRTRIGG